MRNKKKVINIIYYCVIILCMWAGATSTIQRFKCTKLTESELFFRIQNSFILNFKTC